MIHYIDGKPHQNITLRTTRKRHAVEHYRHTQRMRALRDTLARLLVALVASIAIATIYLVATN